MKHTGYTKVPDVILDQHLKSLSEAELKVLLVIIRNTIGWHKERDRLAYSQIKAKTQLSGRSITTAIESLSNRNYINITDKNGRTLSTQERRYRKEIFYAPTNFKNTQDIPISEKSSKTSMQNLPLTIYSPYTQQKTQYRDSQNKKQTDKQRFECIQKRSQGLSCSCLRCAKG